MVTHDMMEALLSADLIAVMNAGRLLQLGTPAELMARPADPFVEALMANPKQQTRQLESLMAGANHGSPA
jgi:osmoprotectant transport system ATP-binding protein